MIFKVDIVWGQALARAEKFHSMCTQTAHTPIFVNFDENGRNFWEKNTPKMCLLGAHTDTPFWGPKPPTIPQNISKFHALTIICRKDTACGKNVTEIGSTFFKCMNSKSKMLLEFKIGITKPILEFKNRNPFWNSKSEFHFGIQNPKPILEFKI